MFLKLFLIRENQEKIEKSWKFLGEPQMNEQNFHAVRWKEILKVKTLKLFDCKELSQGLHSNFALTLVTQNFHKSTQRFE